MPTTVSSSAAGSSEAPIPGAQHLPKEGNPAKFASGLKAELAGRVKPQLVSVLVCPEKGARYASIERAVQQEEARKIFYRNGGLEEAS